jgi:hypothetical protein
MSEIVCRAVHTATVEQDRKDLIEDYLLPNKPLYANWDKGIESYLEDFVKEKCTAPLDYQMGTQRKLITELPDYNGPHQ